MFRRWRVRHSYPQPVVELVVRLAPIHGAAVLSRWLDIPTSVIYRWRAKSTRGAAPAVGGAGIETLATLLAQCEELGFGLPAGATGERNRTFADPAHTTHAAHDNATDSVSPPAPAAPGGGGEQADAVRSPAGPHAARRRYVFDASKERPARAVRRRMEAVRHAVDTGYFLEVDCRTLAAKAGMSLHHFIRVFRDMFGMSPHRYLMHARVEAAKRLLLASSEPLEVIAVGVGFRSGLSLNRAFKRIEGASASRYCQRLRRDGITERRRAAMQESAGHGA